MPLPRYRQSVALQAGPALHIQASGAEVGSMAYVGIYFSLDGLLNHVVSFDALLDSRTGQVAGCSAFCVQVSQCKDKVRNSQGSG